MEPVKFEGQTVFILAPDVVICRRLKQRTKTTGFL